MANGRGSQTRLAPVLARGLGSLVTLRAVYMATSVNHRPNPTAAPLAEATLAARVLRSPSPVHLWPQRSALNCPSPQPHIQQLCCPQALCCGPLPWTALCPVLRAHPPVFQGPLLQEAFPASQAESAQQESVFC